MLGAVAAATVANGRCGDPTVDACQLIKVIIRGSLLAIAQQIVVEVGGHGDAYKATVTHAIRLLLGEMSQLSYSPQ